MKTASKPVPRASPKQNDQMAVDATNPSATARTATPPKKKAVAAKQKAALPTKAGKREARSPRTPRAVPEMKKLICRYCGSDDLAPSFRKRRDARCRACFKKRYGAVARGNHTRGLRKASVAKSSPLRTV